MNIAIFIVVALFLPQDEPRLKSFQIPGLGVIKLPSEEWKLEESHTPQTGAQAFVFKKDAVDVERITIVRFEKSDSSRGLTLQDSHGLCDMMGDSLCEGKPSLWGGSRRDVEPESKKAGTNFMIRLPAEDAVEPLPVTNIYTSPKGKKWMNHGLIASNEKYAFMFVHSSPKVITPDTIENVYLTSPLKTWPQLDSQNSQREKMDEGSGFQKGNKPKIEIYLVTNESTVQHRSQETMWTNGMSVFELEEKTLVGDEEVIGYDWAKHEIVLSASGYRKIPERVPAEGIDFVVTADGLRVYAGTLVTTQSSGAFSWPTVCVNKLPPRPDPKKKIAADKTFRVPIDRHYHGVDEFDHRNNASLKQAFKNSKRLIE